MYPVEVDLLFDRDVLKTDRYEVVVDLDVGFAVSLEVVKDVVVDFDVGVDVRKYEA